MTRRNHGISLAAMVAHLSAPLDLVTEAAVIAWITEPKANNTVRTRLSLARTFFRWAHRNGYVDHNPTADIDHLTKMYPKTYGKAQALRPGRWLTHDEAFVQLVGACRDGSDVGVRDEVVLRLGLAGLRTSELRNVRWGDYVPFEPLIRMTGKGNRIRTIHPGSGLVSALHEHATRWTHSTGTAPLAAEHIICPRRRGGTTKPGRPVTLAYGNPVTGSTVIYDIVTTRARTAGLGHVAPHDLRRTAAGILHRATSADGGHLFDLEDCRQVLDHADCTTTQRSYIDPITSDAKRRAAQLLD